MRSKRNWIILFTVFALAAIIVSLQSYNVGSAYAGFQTRYNNYIIFKQSFPHLLHHQNLYAVYAQEYGDYYKYSPGFALLFAPFYLLPDWLGLSVWNLLNVLLLLLAFFKMKAEPVKIGLLFFIFLLVDVVTSTQNSQCNALMAALLMLAYSNEKKEKYFVSALLVSLATIIKIYGGVGFLLFFFAGNKRKFFVYSLVCMTGLLLLPAVLIGFKELWWQYGNWQYLLRWDLDASVGTSVIGIAGLVFPIENVKLPLQLLGIVMLVLPLLVVCKKDENFEKNYLAFMLVWMILFNHKAESASFVIAFSGATLWIFGHLKNSLALVVYMIAFVLGVLTSTDVFPPPVRAYFLDIHMKAFGFLPIVAVMYAGLFRRRNIEI